MTWTVKNVKSWRGTDGYGTECSLYRDGKKVARCLDEGNGGEMHFEWADRKAPSVEINVMAPDYSAEREEDGRRAEKPHTYRGTPEEKLLAEFANSQEVETQGIIFRKDMGYFVNELCDEYELKKKLKRECRTKTLFKLKGDKPDAHWVVKAPYSTELAARLRAKHGDNLVEIINESLAAQGARHSPVAPAPDSGPGLFRKESMKKGDQVRIDLDSIPRNPSHGFDQHRAKVLERFGLNSAFLQDVGHVLEDRGDEVLYEDWQNSTRLVIPKENLKVEEPKDASGQSIKRGDAVWISLKTQELIECKMLAISGWTHHGCGWMELGIQLQKPDGKKMSHYFPKGRLKR